MIAYTINNTRFSMQPDGTPGQINFVFWSASYTDESVTGSINSRGTPIPEDYPPAQVAYDTLTEADLESWIVDLEDQASIQSQLDAVVQDIQSPQTGTGRPWQESYPVWVVGVAVSVGDIVVYQNTGYECIQAHTTQAQWAPPATPALWTYYVPPSEGPQPWVQPTGSQDAYPLGAQVTHTGNLWTSLVDANVWEPTTANSTLWQDDGVYP